MQQTIPHYLDPAALAKIRGLELRARTIVEGYLSGGHKSPYHGFSVEFAEHREYVPGDDIRHVDWKVFGRTERYYLKQYDADTNLIAWLLCDVSGSMRYASGPLSKYDYAAMLTASIAHLTIHQQDSVGLVTFDDRIRHHLRPSSHPARLKDIVRVLGQENGREKTGLAPIFHDLAERIKKRSLLFVLSDLFDEPEDLINGLRHLRHKRHEIVVFHILDEAELSFPFVEPTLFRGMEQPDEVLAEPLSLRKAYLAEFEEFASLIRRGCRDLKVDYVPFHTGQNLGIALSSYLRHRPSRKT